MTVKLFDSYKFDLNYIIWPLIYILVGVIIYNIIKSILKANLHKKIVTTRHKEKRITTINSMIIHIVKYFIIICVIIAILTVFKVDVKSILAGLGITAAIAGLALQDILKDLLAGMAIISEDQFEIGDIVKIGDFTGEVTSISLRSTRVTDYQGVTKIFANHTITEVINYSLNDYLCVLDISIAYEEDTEKVFKILSKLSKDLEEKIEGTKGPIEILGVQELGSSAVIYRIAVMSNSTDRITVQRRLRKEIKDRLAKENIKIPYNQIEVHNGK